MTGMQESSLSTADSATGIPNLGPVLGEKNPAGWWLYFYEVKVVFEGGSHRSGIWAYRQMLHLAGWYEVVGQPGKTDVEVPWQRDDPLPWVTEMRSNVFYWIDTPGIETRLRGPSGLGPEMRNVDLWFDFEFAILDTSTGRVACDAALSLHLTVNERNASWGVVVH